MHVWCPRRPEDGIEFPSTRVTDSCELSCERGNWTLRLNLSLKEHPVLPAYWFISPDLQQWFLKYGPWVRNHSIFWKLVHKWKLLEVEVYISSRELENLSLWVPRFGSPWVQSPAPQDGERDRGKDGDTDRQRQTESYRESREGGEEEGKDGNGEGKREGRAGRRKKEHGTE